MNAEAIQKVPRTLDEEDNGQKTSMTANNVSSARFQDNPTKDIGDTKISERSIEGIELTSTEQEELQQIREVIGNSQVSRGALAFSPPWILQKAYVDEHDTNWANAYEMYQYKDVPTHANIIKSHVVYKVKTDENGKHKMKARIVPHGNRDAEKDHIRKDSATAQFGVIRLLLSLCTLFF